MTTYIITSILIISLFFIATERQTNINKAAVAIFASTVGWVLYICFGTDYVMSQHEAEYSNFLSGVTSNSDEVKKYIAQEVFLPYIGRAAEIALFLLATMSIVNILFQNGCFDFLRKWIQTTNSKLLLWRLTAVAFLISINLDNVATIVLMLNVTNSILPQTKDRMLYGSMVTIAVIFGGAMTVIGDPTGLMLWSKGAITASGYTSSMAVPCLMAWALPTLYVSTKLKKEVRVEQAYLPFRGDDTRLNIWQRLALLFVGIGGLWFIPTFSDITKLPPFLGAFCTLSLLWIVNEIFNHKIYRADRRFRNDIPQIMQYNAIQQILYVIGVVLALGVVTETGAMEWFSQQIDIFVGNVWGVGVITALISTVLDSFASCLTVVSLHDISTVDPYYAVDGQYWKVLSFGTAVGGSILGIGSITGIVMMQMQDVTFKWYMKNITPLTLVAGIIAFAVLCLQLI